MVTFKIPSRLDATSAPQVERELVGLITNEKPKSLACDFSGTEYVSSAGLRVLLLLTKRLKQTGGVLVLCAMQRQVFDIFKMAGFHTILDIRESADSNGPTPRAQ